VSIRFSCPEGHRLKVPDEKAGRGMLCPVCQESVTVPEADLAPLPPLPPSVEESDSPIAAVQTPLADEPAIPAPGLVPPVSARSATAPNSLARPDHSIPWTLASGLFVVLAYATLPALGHLRDVPMPVWVRILLGASALQAACVLWMLTIRHWAALAVVTFLFALTSIGYAMIAALAFAPGDVLPVPWGLDLIQSRAAAWSATVLAVYLLATYLCGTATLRWRHATLDENA
jgi:hypothetical protein